MQAPIDNAPVTFAVTRRVKRGREAEFEAWARGVIAAASRYGGFRAADVIRPADPLHSHDYVIVFRFDSENDLMAWEQSAERGEWLAKVAPLTVGSSNVDRISGLEFWFSPLPTMPPRYKQAIVTWVALVPTSFLVSSAISALLPDVHPFFRTAIIAAIALALMTYVIMPRMTRWFAGWLQSNVEKKNV
ncbi:MAG: antibiotic biosynthesis monooxygenase [Blastochloris sp.]|nr:antibiotic biosynthesis monooxygenase [Blastochloris sp.]